MEKRQTARSDGQGSLKNWTVCDLGDWDCGLGVATVRPWDREVKVQGFMLGLL